MQEVRYQEYDSEYYSWNDYYPWWYCNPWDYYTPWRCIPCWPDGGGITQRSAGIQVQLQGSMAQVVDNQQVVKFNRILFQENTSINYNAATGEFQINTPGKYLAIWWVAVNGSDLGIKVIFELLIDGQGGIKSEAPGITRQVNGSGLINISKPSTIRLINNSNDKVYYGNVDIQANLVITKID